MVSRARMTHQRLTSIVVKIDADVIMEADRVARAARVSRDEYVAHALRHYNRFHARTKTNHVRWLRDSHVALLFPTRSIAESRPAQMRSKSRKRS